MLTGTCHCGAVTIRVPRRPRRLTECNCSICRRYGTRWAYFNSNDVGISARRGTMEDYRWGDKALSFVRCKHCGCVTHWQGVERRPGGRMGVNMRNFDPAELEGVRVRLLDGAKTWKFLT